MFTLDHSADASTDATLRPLGSYRSKYGSAATSQSRAVTATARTVLSQWPAEQVAAFGALLRGERLVPATQLLRMERSLPHGRDTLATEVPETTVPEYAHRTI